MPEPRQRKYGWKPDLPDRRDKIYKAKLMPLPPKIDLRPYCSPVENQGDIGSCTANALAGALEFLELKDKAPYEDKSRLFIYYNERVIENSILEDSGAMIRDGIKTLASKGVCSEKSWPYDPDQFATMPPKDCYDEAKNHVILAYERLSSLHDIKTCLATGFPVVFGFSVYESFDDPTVAQTGMMPVPETQETLDGGHAICCVGYDDSLDRLIIRNSWGTDWGDSGYFYMPYSIVNDGMADDFWMIRRQNEG
jgi:C1A family cysteine protease